nr:hypothetical protein [Tanacetum cinerariifolium]
MAIACNGNAVEFDVGLGSGVDRGYSIDGVGSHKNKNMCNWNILGGEKWQSRNTNDIGSSKHDSDSDSDSEEVKNMFVETATFMGGSINTKKVEVPPKKTPRKTGTWTES